MDCASKPSRGDHVGLGGSVPARCFPTASALGSSWDTDLARQVDAAVAAEARSQEVAVVLGPGINIKRSPLCGRNFRISVRGPLSHRSARRRLGGGSAVAAGRRLGDNSSQLIAPGVPVSGFRHSSVPSPPSTVLAPPRPSRMSSPPWPWMSSSPPTPARVSPTSRLGPASPTMTSPARDPLTFSMLASSSLRDPGDEKALSPGGLAVAVRRLRMISQILG
jgi:hypothetical protein